MEEEKKTIFQQEDYAPNEMLTNPFFYKTREDRVVSLEDFAIRVKLGLFKKKETVYLRSVIRNPNIKKSKRFSIFSKYIKENKKAFDDNLYLQKEENEKKKDNLKKLILGLAINLNPILSVPIPLDINNLVLLTL